MTCLLYETRWQVQLTRPSLQIGETVKGSAAPTRTPNLPILRESSAAPTNIAREPHFDFVRDKKTIEANDRHFQATQEETFPNNLLQSTVPSLLCVAVSFS